ncbi:aminotransferase class III-fold pyridoxal phosphate-dependent enzyme [Streptomyces sp. KLMMK]|uniref:aminotransferase class III-fold pyridoxal phosphate-dependent enzyme n=1 Tax=Streptomyces sp. KLMMK TaxID=3109353 RepID=UPI00300AEFA9
MKAAAQALLESCRVAWWTAVLAAGLCLGRRDRARSSRLLRAYLLRMGPLYIKAGQVLGTQSGLLPRQVADEFRTFFDQLPPMREPALEKVLRRGLGRPPEEVFEAFDRRPVAAGSVAQVHRAVAGGRPVAVKVVKAGVRGRLEAGAAVIGRLLAVAHLLPRLRGYDLPGHFREMRPLLTGQCDMAAEADRQREVAENFRSHPFVRVPRVHEELCGPDVLVMEYVDGIPGHDAGAVPVSRRELAARLQDAFYCMVYFHGRFHVDPHPGNIVFTPEGRITLLDFGLVGHLSEDDKWNLASFYYACIRKEWALAGRRFTRAFAVRPETLGHAAYEEELGAILRRHFEEQASHWSTLAFLDDAIRLLGRHGTRITTTFSVLALSLLTGEGFISEVDPEIDLWATTRRFTDRFAPYLNEGLRETFQREIGERAPRTQALREEAARHLVAPTHFDRFVLPSAFPLAVAQARGSRLRDLDGNEYVDLSGGYGPHILGYAHPAVVAAIQEAAARGAVNAVGNPDEVRLAGLIAAAFGPDHKVVLSNSGTEAVQIALRIARARTGRQRVAKFEGHYHGFSDQGLVSSWFRYRGDPRAPEPVGNSAGMQDAVVAQTLVLQYGEEDSLRRIAAHADELACVVLEPMPSALGDFDPAFLRRLAAVCAEAGVLVVYDEVVTGFRVHYGGVQHLAGTAPDLTCLGKIIGGGLPAGAVVGRAEVIDTARTSGDPFRDVDSRAFAGGTMSGNSVTAAAGAATLRELRDRPQIYSRLRDRTAWLVEDLTAQAGDCGVPCRVKGRDSVFSVAFDHATPRLVRDRLAGLDVTATLAFAYHMRRYGVHLPELHTMMLSAAHSDADLEQVSEAFGKSVREMLSTGFFGAHRD